MHTQTEAAPERAETHDMETFDAIHRLIVELFGVPAEPLLRARTLSEAGLDSLATLDLIFAIEARFGISIPAEDLGAVHSLHDLAVLVDRLVSRRMHCPEEVLP